MNIRKSVYSGSQFKSLAYAAVILSASLIATSDAKATTLIYHFKGQIDNITTKSISDPESFGFSVGDWLYGSLSIDSDKAPTSDNGEKATWNEPDILLDFHVQDGPGSGWTSIYASNIISDDMKFEVEDDHGGGGGHDKFKMEDKSSTRPDATGLDGGGSPLTVAFEKLKFELQEDNSSIFTSTALPTDMHSVDIANGLWSAKNMFELKFKDGGDEIKLTGALSAVSVPIPAAVWLFGSGLGLLGWMRRKVA